MVRYNILRNWKGLDIDGQVNVARQSKQYCSSPRVAYCPAHYQKGNIASIVSEVIKNG